MSTPKINLVGTAFVSATEMNRLYEYAKEHFYMQKRCCILYFSAAERCLEVTDITFNTDTKDTIIKGKLSAYTTVTSPLSNVRAAKIQEVINFVRS